METDRSQVKERRKKSSLLDRLVLVSLFCLALFVVLVIFGGAIGSPHHNVKRSQTEAFLAELQSGLDRYQIDNGHYPLNPPSGTAPRAREEDGLVGASILYRHLSGDFDEDGVLFDASGNRDPGDREMTIYVERLDGSFNEDATQRRVIADPRGKGYLLIDPYKSPIHYLAEEPDKREKLTKNPTYDIWSIVNTDPGRVDDPDVRAQYVTNWSRN